MKRFFNKLFFEQTVKPAHVNLAYAAVVNLDLYTYNDFYIGKLTGNITINLQSFTGLKGTKWHIYLEQGATPYTITFGTGFGTNFGSVTPSSVADDKIILSLWPDSSDTQVDYIVTNQ